MSFFDSLIGFAPYAEGVVQRHDQRALQALAQQRQAGIDKQNVDLARANVGKLNAETQALTNKPDPIAAKNQEYQYTVDHPKPVPQKPSPMLKTVDENGRVVYTPANQAAGRQAPTAPKPSEPMLVTLGKDGRRTYTPRSQANGMTAPAPAVAPDRTLVPTQNADGSTVYTPRAQAAGQQVPKKADTGLVQTQDPANPTGPGIYTPKGTAAGMHAPAKAPTNAAGNAQVNREADYVKLMEQSLPQMEALAPRVRPAAVAAALKHPMATNFALNQDEQTYLLNFRNFLAGALHQESGARLSDAQVEWGIQRFAPQIGDTPQTVGDRTKSARQVYEGRKATLGNGKNGGNINLNDAPKADAAGSGDPEFDALMAAVAKRKPPT
jgi:hypothetical protein